MVSLKSWYSNFYTMKNDIYVVKHGWVEDQYHKFLAISLQCLDIVIILKVLSTTKVSTVFFIFAKIPIQPRCCVVDTYQTCILHHWIMSILLQCNYLFIK